MEDKYQEDKKINQLYSDLFSRYYPPTIVDSILKICSTISSLTILSNRSKLLLQNIASSVDYSVEKSLNQLEDMKLLERDIVEDSKLFVQDEIENVRQSIKRVEEDLHQKKSQLLKTSKTGESDENKKSSGITETILEEGKVISDEIKSLIDKGIHTILGPASGESIEERITTLQTIESRDLKEVESEKDIKARIEEIKKMIHQETNSPSRFAPCFQRLSKFQDQKSMSAHDIHLVSVANNLYNAEDCWYRYVINLQECMRDKKSSSACFSKFKPQEFYCISQSKEGLRTLQDLLQKFDSQD
jgi:hypothetical protein